MENNNPEVENNNLKLEKVTLKTITLKSKKSNPKLEEL